jgi:hypothetical protein
VVDALVITALTPVKLVIKVLVRVAPSAERLVVDAY